MRRKKLWKTILAGMIGAALVVSATGCGSSSSSEDSNSETSASTEAETESVAETETETTAETDAEEETEDTSAAESGTENEEETAEAAALDGDGGSYTFEAEYCDYESRDEEWQGGGVSGGGGYYLDSIIKSTNASNKYYLCYTHKADCWVDFEISSDQECDAELTLSLGNELGSTITLTPAEFDVSVNDESLDYDAISIPFSNPTDFDDYTLSVKVHLNEGTNMITLTVLKNELMNGYATGGPMIDCITLVPDNGAVLTQTNYVDNLAYK